MHAYIGRSLNASDKAKIEELEKSLSSLNTDLNNGFNRQAAKIAKDIDNRVKVLGEYKGYDIQI